MLYYYYSHVIIHCVLIGFIVVRFTGFTIFLLCFKIYLENGKGRKQKGKIMKSVIGVYLDNSDFFYHRARFLDAIEMIESGFKEYRLAHDDLEALQGNSVFTLQAKALCKSRIDIASKKIERGMSWLRTAEINMGQWYGENLENKLTFVNVENIKDY